MSIYENNYGQRMQKAAEATITQILLIIKLDLTDIEKVKWIADASDFGQMRIAHILKMQTENNERSNAKNNGDR